MATMLRPKGKARKIAAKVMGVPPNMKKRSKKEQIRNERLNYEETRFIR